LAIAGFGLVLTGPLRGWDRSESSLNRSLQDTRDRTWDSVTTLWSHLGNTEIIIGVCIVAVAVVWWRTRRWWFALVPALAISLQATIFVTASSVIGRARPDVPHLDPAPPTSSYPSGHVGASVALYGSLAIMATTIQRAWLRRTVIGVCSVIPVLVAYARLYRGMHHLSDVVVGAINGLACAGLAATCLVNRPGDGGKMTVIPNAPEVSPPSSARSTTRFGARGPRPSGTTPGGEKLGDSP
jgi:undecaprenyl-diphosphatase